VARDDDAPRRNTHVETTTAPFVDVAARPVNHRARRGRDLLPALPLAWSSRAAATIRGAGGPRERPARCGPPTGGRRAQPGVARDDFPRDDAGERATCGHRGGPGGATLPAGRSSSPAGRSSPHTVAGSGRERVTGGIGRAWPTSWLPSPHMARLVRAVPLCAATCAGVSPTGRRAAPGTAASSARDTAAGGGGALSGDVSLETRSKAIELLCNGAVIRRWNPPLDGAQRGEWEVRVALELGWGEVDRE
jgi:hypothetical protein